MRAGPRSGRRGQAGAGRNALLVAIGVIAVVLVGVTAFGGSTARPYDLDSTEASGLKGMRLILESLGARVTAVGADSVDGAAAGRFDAVFIPVAGSGSTAQVDRWRDYVRAGGHLVLGTPTRALGVEPTDAAGDGPVVGESNPGRCTMSDLADLGTLAPIDAPDLAVPDGSEFCYGQGSTAQIVRRRVGDGTVTNLSSPDLFSNDLMRSHTVPEPTPQYDNSVVAQRLLDPAGNGRIAVVESGVAAGGSGPGTRTMWDFMRPGMRLALWELAVVVALFALWRGRRHGRVVTEPQVVEIAGSELVAAVGDLRRRQHHPDRAAATMRARVGRELTRRLGMPGETRPEVLAGIVAHRTNRDPDEVLAALAGRPVDDDSDLIEVARALETIRQEILHG